jgi:hypothetical protein
MTNEIKTLGELIGVDTIQAGIDKYVGSINCSKPIFTGSSRSSNDYELMRTQVIDHLRSGKRIIDVNGGSCDGAVEGKRILSTMIKELPYTNNPSKVYMICNPGCNSEWLEADRFGDSPYKRLEEEKFPNMPTIVFGTYLSTHAGWDCGNARNPVKRLSGLKFQGQNLVKNWQVAIGHKSNPEATDLEIFRQLLE